jgi:hypothetical protein
VSELLLGTNTSGVEQNQLRKAKVLLPLDKKRDAPKVNEETEGTRSTRVA